ncbi:LPS assembly lipoprotein LptE [Aestuariivirga sp.]|uniref:LPS assembly lipoprotein LptE n=1 Tax=Aestuariivirga sp. TaxID=2650926 RepID=UPI003BAD4AB8
MRRASAILLLTAALALAGCGYRPLYGSSSVDPGVAGQLASISIPEAENRVGQIIRNDLISSLQSGKGQDKYILNLATTVNDTGVIQKKQPAVTRQAILITVNYDLVDRSTGTVLTKGTTFARAAYDVIREPFADLQAQTDAKERAAHEVSSDIRIRIAAWFAKQQQPKS